MNKFDAAKFSKKMGLNNSGGSDTPDWMKDGSPLPSGQQIVRGALEVIQNDPAEEQKRIDLLIRQEGVKLMQKFFCQRTAEGNTKTIEQANTTLQNTPLNSLKEYVNTLYIPPEKITDEMVQGFIAATGYLPQDARIGRHLPELVSIYLRANDLNTVNEIQKSAKTDLRDTAKQSELDWITKFKVNDNIPDNTIINGMQIKPRTV